MDKDKFSYIAHKNHMFCNPISERKIERMLNLMQLKNDDKVIEIGAGKCEVLIRLIEKYNVTATGIDISERFIEEAQYNSVNRVNGDRLNLIKGNAENIISNYLNVAHDLGICIGSTHALGGFEKTIIELKKCVKKSGYIIIGECYWKNKPSDEYLTQLGAQESDYKSHYGNIKAAEELGLISLWSSVANDDDWDEYECLYSMSIENYCYENPQDSNCEEMLQRIRNWRQIYFTMGRDMLGFGLYLFRNI